MALSLRKRKATAPDPVEVGLSEQAQALSLFDEAAAGLDRSNATLNEAFQSSESTVAFYEAQVEAEREKQRQINDAVNKNVRVKQKIEALTQ